MQHLLLLHGALGTKVQMRPLAELLSSEFHIHKLTFSGHGGSTIPNGGYTFDLFVEDIIKYMDRHGIEQANVFGYSMGGYAAVYAASKYPGRFRHIATLGTKYVWSVEGAEREVQMLNPSTILTKVPQFAAHLQKLHGPQWEVVLKATANMMHQLGRQAPLTEGMLQDLRNEVLVGIGEHDTTAGYEDSVTVSAMLPNGWLWVLPETHHPIEKVDHVFLAERLIDFFEAD